MTDLLLCIDTSGPRCAVSLHDAAGARRLAGAAPDIGRGHAEVLIGLLEDVLREAGAGYDAIAKIAVVVGPGSFTGLRVGVAAAKGLALALDRPLVGLSSLEVLAEPHWGGEGRVLAVSDAKRGEVYAALYGRNGAVLAPPRALTPGDLRAFVAGTSDVGRLVAVGTGAGIAQEVLGEQLAGTANGEGLADMDALARLAAARTPEGPLQLLYLRGADAKPAAPTGISRAAPQASAD